MTVIIRPAGIDDAAQLGQVHVDAWQAAYSHVMPAAFLDALDPAGMADQWRRGLSLREGSPERGPQRSLVAEVDGQIVAMSTVGPHRDAEPDDAASGELWMLNAAPAAWGTGAATALHAAALGALQQAGHVEAVLWVVDDNPRARRFYEREGWVDDGVTKTDTIGGADIVECRYRIALPATGL